MTVAARLATVLIVTLCFLVRPQPCRPAGAGLTVTSLTAAGEPDYELATQPAPPLKAGQRARLSLTVLPRAGQRLLADGPLLVRLTGQNVAPERALLRREDAVDPRAEAPRFELPLRAGQPGPARLDARCTFYLCQGERCRPVEAGVAFALTVE